MANPPAAGVQVLLHPRSEAQRRAIDLWPRSRVLFLLGPAGTGKTAVALGLALAAVLRAAAPRLRLLLTRPTVACDEDLGYLPGDLGEKLGPWLAPFRDVLGDLSFAKWDDVRAAADVELVPVGLLRGRTVANGVLVADEAQNMTAAQVKCLLTRVGRNGRLIVCGDPDQSDRFAPGRVPVLDAARRLADLDTVSLVQFTAADVVRDPLVGEILARLP